MKTINLTSENPSSALTQCYAAIKEGSFTLPMLQRVEQHESAWRLAGPSVKRKAAFVTSEIYDHFGAYDRAEVALRRFDYDLRDVLESLKRDAARSEPSDLIPRMWLVLALAQVQYRATDFHRSTFVMHQCTELLDRFDPLQGRFLGTRARILTMTGQSLRQTADYDEAIKCFTESSRFANARFIQKTPALELKGPDGEGKDHDRLDSPEYLAAQRLAHWTTANNLALGMGWIRYVTGRLASATNCLATGSTLLRALRDPIYRAYCQLLMAAVARAKDADDPEKVRKTLAPMKDAASGLTRHPLFSIRAHYELSLVYLHLGDQAGAREEIDRLVRSLKRPEAERFARWECAAQILESRWHRHRRDFKMAADLANQALERAQEEGRRNWEIEALIARGEALGLLGEPGGVDHAIRSIEHARELSKNNPKTEAVCTLHLAQLHFRQHREDRARDEFNRWRVEYDGAVEHGFVKSLARAVERQLGYHDPGSVFVLRGDRLDVNLIRLEKELVKRVLALGLDRDAEKRRLGLKTERQVQRLQEKHSLSRTSPANRVRKERRGS